jgi:hypothetical protein
VVKSFLDNLIMSEIVITLEQLRGMIGIELCYNNKECQVVEVLEDGPSLVLQYSENDIQKNQHGNAHRRVPETFCIPVLSGDKNELSEVFLSLDLIN